MFGCDLTMAAIPADGKSRRYCRAVPVAAPLLPPDLSQFPAGHARAGSCARWHSAWPGYARPCPRTAPAPFPANAPATVAGPQIGQE
jgi:hypothetical protein